MLTLENLKLFCCSFLTVLSLSEGLKCYQCGYPVPSLKCANFPLKNDTERRPYEVACDPLHDVCMKSYFMSGGKKYVERKCAESSSTNCDYASSDYNYRYSYTSGEQATGLVCCNHDLCNTGSLPRPVLYPVMMISLLMLLINT